MAEPCRYILEKFRPILPVSSGMLLIIQFNVRSLFSKVYCMVTLRYPKVHMKCLAKHSFLRHLWLGVTALGPLLPLGAAATGCRMYNEDRSKNLNRAVIVGPIGA